MHSLMIGYGLRDLIKCLEAQPRLMAFPMQLIKEYIIYIHILKFKLLRWMMMMWKDCNVDASKWDGNIVC